jgi:hypothetical protein
MRPVLLTALRHLISRIGVALTTASAVLFIFLLVIDLLGFLQNPYAGIVVFIMLPVLFVLGLLLIPVGLWLERRRGADEVVRPGRGWI